MLYQLSMSLHKIYNIDSWHLNFETITVIDQMILSSRQVNFQILRNNRRKIGLNTTANKLYHLNNQIGLERLNLNFAHFKKLSKIQFLKYGNTWSFRIWMPGVHRSPNGHESMSYEAVFVDVLAYLLLYNQLNNVLWNVSKIMSENYYKIMCITGNNLAKGHESKLYKALMLLLVFS